MTIGAGITSWLGPILLEAGAEQLRKMIGDGAAGRLAGGIVEQIAGKLGIPPTQTSIEQAYREDKSEVIDAVRSVDDHYQALARMEEARAVTMQSQHRLQETELGSGLLARIGRPLNTIFFAVECLALMLAVCWIVVRGIPASLDFNQVAPLLALVVPVLTAQAGVIGWDARQQRLAGAR